MSRVSSQIAHESVVQPTNFLYDIIPMRRNAHKQNFTK